MPGSEGQIPYTFSLSVARCDEKAPSHVFVCNIKTDQKRTDGEEREEEGGLECAPCSECTCLKLPFSDRAMDRDCAQGFSF